MEPRFPCSMIKSIICSFSCKEYDDQVVIDLVRNTNLFPMLHTELRKQNKQLEFYENPYGVLVDTSAWLEKEPIDGQDPCDKYFNTDLADYIP